MNVSISKIKLFKACRRAYELKYVHELEPVEKAESLETGLAYHELLEKMYSGENIETDFSKECAMAMAYRKYIFPRFKVKSVEDWFRYRLPNGDTLIGRTDGITEDGYLVEHKTTSVEIGEDYEYGLMWDEQILAYMLATGTRRMWYTICRKPTIRQKKGETEEDFFRRMIDWYDDDTDSKIRLLLVERTDGEVNIFADDLQKIVDEMRNCSLYYKNCLHCQRYGRRCEYSSICLHYDPDQEHIEFRKKETES